jgi:hypothetical protein
MPRSSNKPLGELAEARFLVEAQSRGLIVARPWGDSLPFDFVVGGKRRWFRVQVKSASRPHCRGWRLMCARSGTRKPYTPRDIDFLAAYVVPERTWYIIPVRAFAPRKAIVLFPHLPPAARRYERFRDAWHLLDA